VKEWEGRRRICRARPCRHGKQIGFYPKSNKDAITGFKQGGVVTTCGCGFLIDQPNSYMTWSVSGGD
jgi:hypothetical protein